MGMFFVYYNDLNGNILHSLYLHMFNLYAGLTKSLQQKLMDTIVG